MLIGGFAVGAHGHPRTTKDIDVWVATSADNVDRLVGALREFGFDGPSLRQDLFLTPGNIVRMGVPPLRIEILNRISGVEFVECYSRRVSVTIDEVQVSLISLEDLKANKRASGRPQDLADLDSLS